MRTIRYVVVHTSATVDKAGKPVDATAESIRRYHVEHNGWNDIGYHYVIRMNGSVEYGRALAVEGAHVGGFNPETIGICVSGNGDVMPFTVAQRRSLATLCAKLCKEFGLPAHNVIGHREADEHGAPEVYKTCPGTLVDLDAIRADVQLELDVLVRAPKTPPLPAPPSVPFDLLRVAGTTGGGGLDDLLVYRGPPLDAPARLVLLEQHEALEARVRELERLLVGAA